MAKSATTQQPHRGTTFSQKRRYSDELLVVLVVGAVVGRRLATYKPFTPRRRAASSGVGFRLAPADDAGAPSSLTH
jgi:hypothetical protein